MDLIQISRDKGETWEDYPVKKCSCQHNLVKHPVTKKQGHAIMLLTGYGFKNGEPEEDFSGTVWVRVERASGQLQPVTPLVCHIIHGELQIDPDDGARKIQSVIFDGRKCEQL